MTDPVRAIHRKVVVTGASSFVGCHLAHRFAISGHDVIATHTRPFDTYGDIQGQRLSFVRETAQLAQLDIRDDAGIAAIIDQHTPDLWVHHAGFATNYASPEYDLETGFTVNVLPLQSLFRRLANTGTDVIVTGSSAEYSDSDAADRESDACWPSMPYGLCKLAETQAAKQYAAQFGVSTRVARVYIPFGTLDAPNKLLAHVIRCLRDESRVDLSPCTQRRDFIGIADLTEGFLALARDLERGGFDLFNLSSGQATPLRDLVTGIANALGADRALLDFGARPMRAGEPDISFGDNTKARTLLKWSPAPLQQAIERDLL